MISDIESGKISVKHIVSYDLSRQFRNRTDLGNYENRMAEVGVTFICASQRFSSDLSGIMSRNIMAEFHTYIPMATSIRVKEAQIALAKQGFWPGGRPCYGIETYVVERFGKKVRRKLGPRSHEAAIVRKIFQLRLIGDAGSGPMGASRIAEWLVSKSIRTRSGAYFNNTIIHHMLTNPAYVGRYLWNVNAKDRSFVQGDEDKEVFEFKLEAIIDEETFYRVQKKLEEQDLCKGGDTWVYTSSLLLRELAYCTCGSRLGLATGTGSDGDQRRYYLCNRRKKLGKLVCTGKRINEDILDKTVVGAIREAVLDGERVGRLLKAWTEKEALAYSQRFQQGAEAQAKADRADREVQRLILLARGDDDLVTDPIFRQELSRAREAAAADFAEAGQEFR
jgi:DNA invertase Pin-like site-specific DNA recombinase